MVFRKIFTKFHKYFINILQKTTLRGFLQIFYKIFAKISQKFRKNFAKVSQKFRKNFAKNHVKSP